MFNKLIVLSVCQIRFIPTLREGVRHLQTVLQWWTLKWDFSQGLCVELLRRLTFMKGRYVSPTRPCMKIKVPFISIDTGDNFHARKIKIDLMFINALQKLFSSYGQSICEFVLSA